MSSAVTAAGTTLEYGDTNGGASTVWTTIPEIKDIQGPDGTVETIDVSNHSSTGSTREFKAGLIDEGQLTIPFNYIPDDAAHLALRTIRDARALRDFRITMVDTSTTVWTFEALVTGVSISAAVDGIYEGTLTLKISGVISES